MATIFAVHGTFASGPEEGPAWWQRGSAFESDLRRLVEADDGTLLFQPVVWDGANSEASRRVAAARLQQMMKQAETDGQPYCLIGHSHGGSVVSTALMINAFGKTRLNGLSRWITVGTPFAQMMRAPFLFSQLQLAGKSAYVALVTLGLVLFLYFAGLVVSTPTGALAGVIGLIGSLPFVIVYFVLRARTTRRLFIYNKSGAAFADQNYGGAWVSLCHPDDEALQGLRAAVNTRIPIFDKSFATSALSFASIFLLPALVVLLITSEQFANWLFPHVSHWMRYEHTVMKDGQLIGLGKDYLVNLTMLIETLHHLLMSLFRPRGALPYQSTGGEALYAYLALFIGLPLIVYGTSLAITYVATLIASAMSAVLSRILNRMTWSQIRGSAMGIDVPGEHVEDARAHPMWRRPPFVPLPRALCDEMSERANAVAAQSLAKFRSIAGRLVTVDDNNPQTISMAEYLTWDELIHTSYFNSERFRKLVAFVVAGSPGFRPSTAFKSDPDYQLIAGWCEQLKPEPAAAKG